MPPDLRGKGVWRVALAFLLVGAVFGCGRLMLSGTDEPDGLSGQRERTVSRPLRGIGSSLVRGYLAVAIGNSSRAEVSRGIFDSGVEAKDIYLPRVAVYLQDAISGNPTDPVQTDLSGRFTLPVPRPSRYRLCWKSKLYGDDCLQEIFNAGDEPLFLGTALIPVPFKSGFVASFGKVRFNDDSAPRTLEPLADINSFAIVSLFDSSQRLLAEVPVNNMGDYLLPYLPSRETVELVARIEKASSVQLIHPDAYRNQPRLVQYHLTIDNSRPRFDAIVPLHASNGERAQIATPGEVISLKAEARDPDGDTLSVSWLDSTGSGTLSSTTGNAIEWSLPRAPGRYSVLAIVADGKGGYDRYTVRLSVGAPGVVFSGVVAGSDGTLLEDAAVTVNGELQTTDGQGRFTIYVPEESRYALVIRKAGYGFYAKIYDRSVAGGRWTLTRATVATFLPTAEIILRDRRSPKNCPGPASGQISWEGGRALRQVFWQDGRGNDIPPPADDRQQAILPWERPDPSQGCGPGIEVTIPPNALETESGKAPTGKVEVTLATVDLATPEQMPGDDTVETSGRQGWMQSYGAGSVELRDTGTGQRLNLKSGATAEVMIPVDRSQLAVGAPLPPTVPLLFYDEVEGLWRQEGTLTLDPVRQGYVAKVAHFSVLNADVVFTNPSCVRVQSTIAPIYDLEVTIPLPGGAAPKIKTLTITDAPPHVLYNLPNDTNITIVAIAPGSGTTPPRSLGIFIVNTGPPQAGGFGSPPPPSACSTEVTLSAQTFPQQPNSGEFLHGLFSFAATTINEAEIPIPGSISQQLDQATINYYKQVDPGDERKTLTGFRNKNNFTKPPGFQLCGGNVCDDPDQEINVVFANSGDLGFGRDMHCRRTDTDPGPGTDYDYACYVTNYGDILTDDPLDAENARTNTGVVATVAMEYSRILATDPVTDRHVKFYVYNAAGDRINRADLDSGLNTRQRPIPQLCMVCHGGAYPGGGTTGVPPFNTPDSVKLGARFLPFDLRFYTFPASPDKAAQQTAMKRLNQDIVRHAPSLPAPDPIADVVDAMYSGGSATQHEEFVVPGWAQTELPNTVVQENFYRRVVGNACRTCHIAQPFANVSAQRAGVDLQFRSARDFLRSQPINGGGSFSALSSAEQRACADHVMPHARRTHDIFWGQYWQNSFGPISPTLAAQFQVFGDSIKALPRPAGWPAGESWPPAWNGQLCGPFTSPGSTPASFYSAYVHVLWNRDYGTAPADRCTSCHGDLTGNATDTRNKLLAGFFGTPEVVSGNPGASEVVKRLKGLGGGARMPQGCTPGSPSLRCLNENGGVYNPAADPNPGTTTFEIDRVIHWITTGVPP